MLVKVRNDDPSRLSATERTVVNWLKSWSGPHAVPGIAIVQCQDADVVVWTPQTSVVVGVHGFTERVTGTLTCAQDEPWTIDGKPAPIDGDANPLERVRRQTAELARQLRSAPGREEVPVSGLVLLCPQLGSRIKLEKGELPPGIDVLIGDGPSSLRNYFTTIAEGADPSWDAAQVGQALGALGFAAAATYSDLVSEGFPPPESARTSPPPLAAAPTVKVPSVPVQQDPPPAPPPPATEARSGSGESAPGKPADEAPQQEPEKSGKGKAAAGGVIAGGAAAAAAVAAYRHLTGGSSPSDRPERTPDPQGPAAPPPTQPGPGAPQVPGAPHGSGQPQGPGVNLGRSQPAGPQAPAGPQGPGQALAYGAQGPGAPQQPRPQAPQRNQPPVPPNAPPTAPVANPQAPYAAPPTRPTGGPGFPIWNTPQSTTHPTKPRRRKDIPIVGAIVLVFLILLIAAMCTGRTTSTKDDETNTPTRPTTSQRTTTPGGSTTTDPTIPKTTIPPACFPLDPNC
ncbi:NERD domain-containing protein [Nocardia sp. NPDC055321]